jgi:hypothetical protein
MGRRETSTTDLNVGQPADIILKDGTLATGGATVEPVETRGLNDDFMDELAFMEEEVTVMVHESTDENADNPVLVGCNGVFKQFFRGQPTIAKRKFVDCLIVKMIRVTTPEFTHQTSGERGRKIVQTSAMKYPFSIVEDKSPKGGEWLRRRMADTY